MSVELIANLPWAEYAVPGFLGSSALSDWTEMSREGWSAEYMEQAYADGKKGPWITNGSELDKMLTEAVYDRSRIEVKPKGMSFATKEGKVWRDAREGKTIIREEDLAALDAALPLVREAIEAVRGDLTPEFQVTLRGEIAGLKVQTRPDIRIGSLFPDLKYVSDIDGFDRNFWNSRYMFQAGLFFGLGREVLDDVRVSFLLAESGTTHPRVRMIEIPESTLLHCWRKTVERVEEIARVIESPLGLTDVVEFRTIDLPAWVEREIENA